MLRHIADPFDVAAERIFEYEAALEEEVVRIGVFLAIEVDHFSAVLGHLHYFVDQLLVEVDEFVRGLGDLSNGQDLLEESWR